MKERKELLAYCGIYCGDCLGYTGAIADATKDFKMVLDKYKFDRSAKCIFPDQLKDYDRFYEIVGFMSGLKCPMICREREDAGIVIVRSGNAASIMVFMLVMNAMILRFVTNLNHHSWRDFIMMPL